ncbi:MAG: glycoside hydrolase family 13 protein [Lachnospiraceae bacterium]|nr:glycoside hydrolase family 13 protein [Lachnospiraceae bacterium]
MEPINRRALFSDESESFLAPFAPKAGQKVTITLRTAKENVSLAQLLVRGEEPVSMVLRRTDELFDFFEVEYTLKERHIHYAFRVENETGSCYYQRFGAVDELQNDGYFLIVPGFTVPEWSRGAVYYQIFVDRFCNGDPTNDVLDNEYSYLKDATVEQVKDWNSLPQKMDVARFYGGDLQGILNKLDYLGHLGVQVIYLNPIFVSPSNHKYDTQDYDYIDPHYGVILPETDESDISLKKNERYRRRVASSANLEASNRLFIRLIEEAHRRGMKVVIDGVFNHCGSFNKWMDRELIYEGQPGYELGAYVSEKSPYRTFFCFKGTGKWPYNEEYKGWWDHATLPKLNYEGSPELYQYMLNIGRKWVSSPFNVDGWRLDVAADLGDTPETNHRFWQDFRAAVREANPEAIVFAEHYGDPAPWLNGKEWDTVMNYDGFMEPVTWFFTGMEKHSDRYEAGQVGDSAAFFHRMKCFMGRTPRPAVEAALNQLSNHDHSRFLTRTNHKAGRIATLGSGAASEGVSKDILRAAVIMQMTWPGAPGLYYGDEAGLCGFTDPDNRRTYPWGREDFELIEFHCDASWMHYRHSALQNGALKPLLEERNLLAYGRFNDEEQIVVAVNTSLEERQVELPVWEAGVAPGGKMIRLMKTGKNGYNVGRKQYEVTKDGKISVRLNPMSSAVYLAVKD